LPDKRRKTALDQREISQAQVGPRELKDPRSKAYAIQTLYALKRYSESLRCDQERVEKELAEIERYRHWEVLGYPSKEALLSAELNTQGLANVAKVVLRARAEGRLATRSEAGAAGGRGIKAVDVVNSFKVQGGNDAAYLSRRLLRDAPDTFAALERGEFKSVRAAAKVAGIIRDRTPLQEFQCIWKKATLDQQEEMVEWALAMVRDARGGIQRMS
jgi:hypothetical protein